MAAENLIAQDTRRRIFEQVQRAPGSHLRQLQRDLQLPLGTLEYHLYRLERGGLVATRTLSRYKSYFVSSEIDRNDKDYLYFLRQEMPRRLLSELGRNETVSFRGLLEHMPIAASTVSFHLQKLVGAGLVVESRPGRSKAYRVAEPDRLHRLLDSYGHTFARPAAPIEVAAQPMAAPAVAPWAPAAPWAKVDGSAADAAATA